jgi:beta-glucuronidase
MFASTISRYLKAALFTFAGFLALLASWSAHAQASAPTILVDIDHRAAQSLNGPWHFIIDPYRNGWGGDPAKPNLNGYAKNADSKNAKGVQEYDFAQSPTIEVPGDWNSQRPELFLYEGMVWYERDFDYQLKQPHTRVFLHFGAANYVADVFVNGMYICSHIGGFTPFDCDATIALENGKNSVVVAVDNTRHVDAIPTLKTDWWNYGGLTREVSLVIVPQVFIDDYSLQLVRGTKDQVEGYVHLEGLKISSEVELSIPELRIRRKEPIDADGYAKFSFQSLGMELWSPDHPRLYRVEMRAEQDVLKDDIGFRTIEVKGTDILLNGEPIFLRGVCAHAEAPYRSGRAWSEKDAETLEGWAQDLNANFMRLAHYPHDEHMTREADKLGIMIWSEVPVYWGIDWTSPEMLALARQQIYEMIRRDHNKASVILWSVANETTNSPERLTFLRDLIAHVRQQDPSRLVTAALLPSYDGGKVGIMNDPLSADLDVMGYNEYIGWYRNTPPEIAGFIWKSAFENKPLIMSEFGAEAKAGLHGEVGTRWTEESQEYFFQQQIEMLKKIPNLRGTAPWVLMDFRSPTRQLPGLQDYYNRKGLVSDKGEKKKAFSVIKDWYASMPE